MAENLRTKATERYAQAREKAGAALETGKTRVRQGAIATRDRASKAKAKASQGFENNPLGAVAGGLAIGAIIAALLPRSARETKLMGPVSRSVKATARTAAKVAGNVAKAELIALGVSGDAARQQVRELAGKIGKAASSAGSAAAKTVRKDK
jgi:ElaB/YqjD/DUF883 family membrane-anchored ribosome-binding protein